MTSEAVCTASFETRLLEVESTYGVQYRVFFTDRHTGNIERIWVPFQVDAVPVRVKMSAFSQQTTRQGERRPQATSTVG